MVFSLCDLKQTGQENTNRRILTCSFLPVVKLHWTALCLVPGCSATSVAIHFCGQRFATTEKFKDHPTDLEKPLAYTYVILFIQHG